MIFVRRMAQYQFIPTEREITTRDDKTLRLIRII
jgi:hypothetical protein